MKVQRIDFEELQSLAQLDAPEATTSPKDDIVIKLDSLEKEDNKEKEENDTEEVETNKRIGEELLGFDDELNYRSIVNKYLEEGLWEDVILDDDGNKLSELDNVTRDDFFKISQEQKRIKEEILKENTIDKSDFDETQAKVIDLMRSGATPQELKSVFDFQEKFIHPLKQYDLTNEAHAAQLLLYKYRVNNPDLSDEAIQYQLKVLKQRGELFEEAERTAQEINDEYLQRVDAMQKDILEKEKSKKEALKEVVGKVNASMNERKVKDSVKRTVRDFLSRDLKGENITKEINSLRSDNPEKLTQILVLLANEQEFQRVYGKTKSDEASRVLRKINFSAKPSGIEKQEDNQVGEGNEFLKDLKFIQLK